MTPPRWLKTTALSLAFLGAVGWFGVLQAVRVEAQNTTCSNRTAGDSTNACANTRFVTSALSGFITAITGGTGISISGPAATPTVSQNVTSTTGISITGSSPMALNTNLSATTGISLTGASPQAIGWSATAGTGISISGNPPVISTSGGGGTTTIASGAKTLATGAIGSATCTTAQTATATGTLTTDAIIANFATDPTSQTGYAAAITGMLAIIDYPTADTVNFKVCNNTTSSITPGSVTINWRVVR